MGALPLRISNATAFPIRSSAGCSHGCRHRLKHVLVRTLNDETRWTDTVCSVLAINPPERAGIESVMAEVAAAVQDLDDLARATDGSVPFLLPT